MKTESETIKSPLSIKKARAAIQDLFAVKPKIYYTDFLLSAISAWSSFILLFFLPPWSLAQVFCFIFSGVTLYRAVLFVHELAHLADGKVRWLFLMWNTLIGVPNMIPSYMYKGPHLNHHKSSLYGTDNDGEYLPFGVSSWQIVYFLFETLAIPLILIFRSLVAVPASILHPKLCDFVYKRSSLMVNLKALRTIPKGRDWTYWKILDAGSSIWGWTFVIAFATGFLPIKIFYTWYAVSCIVMLLNAIRTLVAHRYAHDENETMSFENQILDSVNLTGDPFLQEIVAPVGLRFHALHHLFPSLPYHAMSKAHAKLIEALPKNSLYHEVSEQRIGTALKKLFRGTKKRCLSTF